MPATKFDRARARARIGVRDRATLRARGEMLRREPDLYGASVCFESLCPGKRRDRLGVSRERRARISNDGATRYEVVNA